MEEKAEYITDANELMGWKESKQVSIEFSGFVMIYDCVLRRYGNLTKSAVHGAILRFCGMEDRVCKASLKTIGEMIGVDKATVMRYAKELCDDGYLKDLTPNLRNKPHVYADTGIVQIKNRLSVEPFNATVAQNNTSVAGNNATVAQSKLTRVSNKDSNTYKPKREQAKERIANQRAERGSIDPVTEILKADAQAAPRVAMRLRIEQALSMNLAREWDLPKSDWHGYDQELVIREQETGETIERFMSWFNDDEFRRKSGVWLKPSKIEQMWPQAFKVDEEYDWRNPPEHAL